MQSRSTFSEQGDKPPAMFNITMHKNSCQQRLMPPSVSTQRLQHLNSRQLSLQCHHLAYLEPEAHQHSSTEVFDQIVTGYKWPKHSHSQYKGRCCHCLTTIVHCARAHCAWHSRHLASHARPGHNPSCTPPHTHTKLRTTVPHPTPPNPPHTRLPLPITAASAASRSTPPPVPQTKTPAREPALYRGPHYPYHNSVPPLPPPPSLADPPCCSSHLNTDTR
jgi:hypothetical protein